GGQAIAWGSKRFGRRARGEMRPKPSFNRAMGRHRAESTAGQAFISYARLEDGQNCTWRSNSPASRIFSELLHRGGFRIILKMFHVKHFGPIPAENPQQGLPLPR